jgi:hypothetical protein
MLDITSMLSIKQTLGAKEIWSCFSTLDRMRNADAFDTRLTFSEKKRIPFSG